MDRLTPCRGASIARRGVRQCVWLVVAAVMLWLSRVDAQQLLDRVVARVSGVPITLTDVRIATALGVIDAQPNEDPQTSAARQLIDRELELTEVTRFPPQEPSAADIDKQVAAYKARVGNQLAALMQSTGLTEERLRQMARSTVRIQAYLAQRFGTASVVPAAEVRRYYEAHPSEFMRDGRVLPFDDVEPIARDAASSARRRGAIAQWLRDLRGRTDVFEPVVLQP